MLRLNRSCDAYASVREIGWGPLNLDPSQKKGLPEGSPVYRSNVDLSLNFFDFINAIEEAVLNDDHLGADADPFIKVLNILIAHPDTA